MTGFLANSYLKTGIRYFCCNGLNRSTDACTCNKSVKLALEKSPLNGFYSMDIAAERSYPTPFAKSAILPLLLLSLTSQKHTPKTAININTEYDYVIVGGGTAGSVVASRLSELPCVNVLLLEAGKDPPLLTEVPALSRFFRFSDIDWNYKTVPQKHTGEALMNNEIPLANGKTLGGSSVLNSVVATRGSRSDYDNWAAKGAVGWSYKDLLPYFKKLEDNKDPEYIKNGFHSVGGLQSIQRPRYQPDTKKSIFQAVRSMGFKVVDPNAWRQTGFYDFQAPLRGGVRCSTAKAYLVPAENRTNLHILSNAMVRKVIINDREATGVVYDHDGETYEVTARKEVILSAGTFNTAKLLMLSGIGPRKELNKLKIPVLVDLPVGKNLQDHCAVPLNFLINSSIAGVLKKLVNPLNVDQYIKTKSGVLASPDFITALGFVNSQEDGSRSDAASFQIRISEETTIIPKLQYGFKQEVYSQVYGKFESKPYITCLSQTLRPRSRGTIRLHSIDPYDPPLIDPNFMEDPKDVRDIVEGLKICRKLAATPPMQKLRTTSFGTLYPGCEEYRRNEELRLWCLTKQVAISMNNPVGTAKMGDPRDPTTVVDTELRVKYVRRLRVIDSSIMPTIISGDTSIPTIMIAEKGSDIIKSSIDCEDEVAESDVQASVPVISISTEILEKLPHLLKKPAQRREDTDSTLEKLKVALGLNKNTKQFQARSGNRVQSQVKGRSRTRQDFIFSRRQEDPSTVTMSEVVKCLEELQQQIKNTKQRETASNVIYTSSSGNDRTVGQIMSALNGIRQNSNIQNNNRNAEPNNEVSPALMNQISSLLERLRGDREVSETSSSGSLMTTNNEAANQISSVLNVLREGIQGETADLSRGNSQNDMVNQLITTIRGIAQSQPPRNGNFPAVITNSNRENNELDAVSQLITTIRGMVQESQPQQNRNSPTATTGSNTGNNENDMVNQLITTIRGMAQESEPPQNVNSPSGTTDLNRGNNENDMINRLITTIQGMTQESQPPRNGNSPTGTIALNRGNNGNDMANQLITTIRGMAQESQPPQNANSPTGTTDLNRGNNENDMVNQLITTIQGMAQESQPPRNGNSPPGTISLNRGNNENGMVNQLITTIQGMAQESQPPRNGNSPPGTISLNGGNNENDMVNQLMTTIRGMAQESQAPQNVNSATGTTDLNRGSNENDMINRLITTIPGMAQESQPPRNGNSPPGTISLNRGNNENDMVNQLMTTIRGMAQESQAPQNVNSATGTTDLNRGSNENDMINRLITTIPGMAQESQPPRNGNSPTGTIALNRGNNGNDMVNQLITTIRGMTQESEPLRNGNSPAVITNSNGGNNENDMVNQIISAMRDVSQFQRPQNVNAPSATSANQQNVQQLMSQIMSSINDIRQIQDATRVLQNRNNNTRTTQNMMNQILSAVNGIRNESMQTENESTTPPSSTENLPETLLQQILSTLNEIKQNNQGSRQWRNNTSSANLNTENSKEKVLKQIFSAIKDIKDSSTLNKLKQNNHRPRQWQDNTDLSNANGDNSKDEVLKEIFSAIKDMKDSSNLNEKRQSNQRQTQWQDSTSTDANKDKSNDEVLKQIFSAIKDMKKDIRNTNNNNNNQTNSGSSDNGDITAIQDSNSRYLQQILNQQMNQNGQGTAPLIQTVVIQENPDAVSQITRPNPILGPIAQPPINGMQFLPPGLPVNPILNLLQRQRNQQILSALTGGNGMGINPPLPPQLLGLPPAVLANLQRIPPPFLNRFPPFIPSQMPCQKTIVLNNLNICNGNGMLQRPITENEIKLCQSLQSATQCQAGNNCRAIHPYLYNYYCGKK